jgi:hypothetical protein
MGQSTRVISFKRECHSCVLYEYIREGVDCVFSVPIFYNLGGGCGAMSFQKCAFPEHWIQGFLVLVFRWFQGFHTLIRNFSIRILLVSHRILEAWLPGMLSINMWGTCMGMMLKVMPFQILKIEWLLFIAASGYSILVVKTWWLINLIYHMVGLDFAVHVLGMPSTSHS